MSRKMDYSACPECGLLIGDPTLVRLGFCPRCEDFTGMCAAGRKVVSPDVMTVTSWHSPCTKLGTACWEVTVSGRTFIVRLCSVHDAEVNAGGTPWLRSPVRLAGQTVPRPRSPA
jgi:hypothetical protein